MRLNTNRKSLTPSFAPYLNLKMGSTNSAKLIDNSVFLQLDLQLVSIHHQVIKESDGFCILLDPWNQPKSFSRIWCLNEFAHAIHHKRPIEMVTESDYFRALETQDLATTLAILKHAVASVDVAGSDATVKTDIPMIQKMVRVRRDHLLMVRFSGLNNVVRVKLVLLPRYEVLSLSLMRVYHESLHCRTRTSTML